MLARPVRVTEALECSALTLEAQSALVAKSGDSISFFVVALALAGSAGLAGDKGAAEEGGKSVALRIELSKDEIHNSYSNLTLRFKYFFARKVMFIKYAVAYVILPGGYGTMDECFEALNLILTEKSRTFPVIFVGKDYWKGLIQWIETTAVKAGTLSPRDMEIFQVIDDPVKVVKAIKKVVVW